MENDHPVTLSPEQARALRELLRDGKSYDAVLHDLRPIKAGMFGPELARKAEERERHLFEAFQILDAH